MTAIRDLTCQNVRVYYCDRDGCYQEQRVDLNDPHATLAGWKMDTDGEYPPNHFCPACAHMRNRWVAAELYPYLSRDALAMSVRTSAIRARCAPA